MMQPALESLPEDSPLRNLLLASVGAQVRNRKGTLWRDVATWKIGRSSFNDLGSVWCENNEFRAGLNCAAS